MVTFQYTTALTPSVSGHVSVYYCPHSLSQWSRFSILLPSLPQSVVTFQYTTALTPSVSGHVSVYYCPHSLSQWSRFSILLPSLPQLPTTLSGKSCWNPVITSSKHIDNNVESSSERFLAVTNISWQCRH